MNFSAHDFMLLVENVSPTLPSITVNLTLIFCPNHKCFPISSREKISKVFLNPEFPHGKINFVI